MSLSATTNNGHQARVHLLTDIESNIRFWHQAHVRLPLLKLLSATPEVDDRRRLAGDVAEVRLQEQLNADKRKERVRKLLITPSEN